MLERMAGRYYKKVDLNNFVDEPFTLYQPYMKRYGLKHELNDKPRFLP